MKSVMILLCLTFLAFGAMGCVSPNDLPAGWDQDRPTDWERSIYSHDPIR